MKADWHFPTVDEEFQLYKAGHDRLVIRVERGEIELASDSVSLVAYEVRPAAKAIAVHAVIGLNGKPRDREAVNAFLAEEAKTWDCPTVLWA